MEDPGGLRLLLCRPQTRSAPGLRHHMQAARGSAGKEQVLSCLPARHSELSWEGLGFSLASIVSHALA